MADDDDQIEGEDETLTPDDAPAATEPARDEKADEKARALTQRVRTKINRLAAKKPTRYIN